MAVVDTSSNVVGGISTLKENGVTAVGRYYSSVSWKRLTKAEAKKISDAGMAIFTVFENNGDPELTEETGAHHAEVAMAQAKNIGQPKNSTIYFALEHLPSGYKKKHLSDIYKYMKGVNSVLKGSYKVGAYSDGVVCKALLDNGMVSHAWLSASTSFEGTKDFYESDRWSLCQRKVDLNWDGLSIDTNEAKADFGAFTVVSAAPLEESIFAATESMAAGSEMEPALTGDGGKIQKLIAIGTSPDSISKVQAKAKKAMPKYGKVYPEKSCAVTLSFFLQEAGIDVPETAGAQKLADRLRLNRHWQKVQVGKQEAGDVGVCYSQSNDVAGADHIYLVVERKDADLMMIADNQYQGAPHPRNASGKKVPGGSTKTATEYFLRAPSGAFMETLSVLKDDVPDENTDDLLEFFMDDGTVRFEDVGA